MRQQDFQRRFDATEDFFAIGALRGEFERDDGGFVVGPE